MAWRGRLVRLDQSGGSNEEYDEERRYLLTALGVPVRKWLGWAGLEGLIGRVDPMVNLMRNDDTISQRL